jgi:hypothetical protein
MAQLEGRPTVELTEARILRSRDTARPQAQPTGAQPSITPTARYRSRLPGNKSNEGQKRMTGSSTKTKGL